MTKIITKITKPYVNPLIHDFKYDNINMLKSLILTVVVLPFRVILIIIFILLSWLLAFIGLIGLSEKDLESEPLCPWRRSILEATTLLMRLAFAAASFMYFRVKGKQASRSEAPILVVAPHSTYMDAMAIIQAGCPSVVVRDSSKNSIFVGRLVNLLQAIVVDRYSSSSRRTTIGKIVGRAKSCKNWPQILIFPEGTTTNRKALLQFKPGAFAPGVPIQPVCIRYPNRHDTFSWTWDGLHFIKLAWLTLTQFYSNFEIEYLPVYKPNQEEIADAKLFANNVRKVMASALDIPMSDFAYEDCLLLPHAKYFKIPLYRDILEIKRLRKLISGNNLRKEEELASNYALTICRELVTFDEFSYILEFNEDDPNVCSLFTLFDKQRCGKISLKNYLICILYIAKQEDLLIDFITSISHIYSADINFISREQFYEILKHSIKINSRQSDELFIQLDTQYIGFINFDDFLHVISPDIKYNFFFMKFSAIKH